MGKIAPFGKGLAEFFEELRDFDVCSAHCYDPNEEAKLKSVIEAVGEARFNAMVRGIPDKIGLQSPKPAHRLSKSWLFSFSSVFAGFKRGAVSESCEEVPATMDICPMQSSL